MGSESWPSLEDSVTLRTGRSVMFSITKVIVTSPGATITLGCTVKSMRRLLAVSSDSAPAAIAHSSASAAISAASRPSPLNRTIAPNPFDPCAVAQSHYPNSILLYLPCPVKPNRPDSL